VAEIASAFAVVLSLVYVGYELRQNTNAVLSDTQGSLLQLVHGVHAWLQSESFADIAVRGDEDYASLTPPERRQYDTYTRQLLDVWEHAYYNNRAGLMEDDLWEAWENAFESIGHSWRPVWARDKKWYGKEFREYVDSRLSHAQAD
jgi:hypothetical protein